MAIRRVGCVLAIAIIACCDARSANAQPTSWLTRAASTVRQQLDTSRPRVLRRSIELDNASLETLRTRLGWIGIELPLQLEGDVTARLSAEVDITALTDGGSYRLNGSLSSRALVVEGLALQNFSATARYVDGRLTLNQLVATVPDPRPGQAAGRIDGEATMQLLPVGALTATLSVNGVPLEQFSRRIAAAAALGGGRLTGRLSAEAPVATLSDIVSWRANGESTIANLDAAGRDVSRAATRLSVSNGVLTLSNLTATIEGEQVTGAGTLGLTQPFDYETTFAVPAGELSRLGALIAQPLPARWSGRYQASANANGSLNPFTIAATGSVTGNGWTAANLPVESFAANVSTDGDTLTLTSLQANALDGDWSGEATLDLAAPYHHQSSLTLTDLDLAQAEPLMNWLAGSADRTSSATTPARAIELGGVANARFESRGALEPRDIDASGKIDIANLLLNGEAFRNASLEGTLTPTAVELTALGLVAENGRLTGRGRIELTESREFAFRFSPERFNLAALDPVIMVAMSHPPARRETVAFQPGANAELTAELPSTDVAAARPSVAGTATGEVDAQGQILPFKLDALDGSLTFEGLTVAGVTFDRAEIVATTENRIVNLSRLRLTKGEGSLEGDGRFGLDAPGTFSATLRPSNFSIDEASPLFGPQGIAQWELPPVSGSLNGEVTVAGETQPFRLETAAGNLAGDEIRIGQLLVDQFEIALATAEDVITVSSLLVAIEDGRLTGDASIGLAGEQPFEATLRPDSFRIELLRPLFGEDGLVDTDFPPVSGRLSGEMTVRGRIAPADVDSVSGVLRSENGSISGVPFQNARLTVSSDNGIATIRELEAVSDFGTVSGRGTLGLAAPYGYTADLVFENFDLAAIGDITAALTEEQRPDIESPAEVSPGPRVLPVDLEGRANLTGQVNGTLAPFALAGEGTAGSDELVFDVNSLHSLFKRTVLSSPRFGWRYNENRLTLSEISAGLGGGRLTGTAAVPLGDAAKGSLALQITDVALADFLELPARIDGIATGDIAASLGPVQDAGQRDASGEARFTVPALRVGRIDAGNVTANVSFAEDVVKYDLTGALFDGPLTAQGAVSLDPEFREASTGTLSWTGGNLARAAAGLSDSPSLAGRIDARLDYDLAAVTKATGTFELLDVRQAGTLLTDRFAAKLLWTDGELRIENTAGGYAGGSVLLLARLDILNLSQGTVEVLLRRADARRAVGWIPGLEPLEGTLDLRLRGRLGQLWRWEGDAEVGRGHYGPLAFSSARVPLVIDANPFRGALRVTSNRANLRAAHGRGILNVSADLGATRRIKVGATFDGLDAAEVLDGDGLGSRVAGGRVSGTLDLSSRNFRTIADLEGSLIASLVGSNAQNLPVIGSVFDVARLPTGGGGNIERGTIRVFVRSGVARIEELALAGRSFRLFAEGTVALASQRLVLNVVADTSPARFDRLFAAFLLRQVIDYATPIGWIERANRFISERAIYVRVTGTVDRPVVRIRPFQQLGQEAVRFLLNEIAGPVGGSTAPALAP